MIYQPSSLKRSKFSRKLNNGVTGWKNSLEVKNFPFSQDFRFFCSSVLAAKNISETDLKPKELRKRLSVAKKVFLSAGLIKTKRMVSFQQTHSHQVKFFKRTSLKICRSSKYDWGCFSQYSPIFFLEIFVPKNFMTLTMANEQQIVSTKCHKREFGTKTAFFGRFNCKEAALTIGSRYEFLHAKKTN